MFIELCQFHRPSATPRSGSAFALPTRKSGVGVDLLMTPSELKSFLDLTAAIEHHKEALSTAVKQKQQLARTLYERYGRHAVYRIGDGPDQLDLTIARTKGGNHYFAPRVRFTKESRYAKAEKKRLDRAARMQRPPTQADVIRPARTEITHAEIDAAMKRGRHDRDRATASRAAKIAPYNPDAPDPKFRLPIVGDVDQPRPPVEPRLLDIKEPSGAMLGDVPGPNED